MDDHERNRRGGHTDERENPEAFVLRRANDERMAGTADRALLAEHIARGRAERELARRSPPLREVGHRVTGTTARVPKHPPMFAKVLGCVDVRHDGPVAGRLSIAIEHKSLEGVVPASVRLARWDPLSQTFSPLSGSGLDGLDVTGRITRDGTYAALGLPDDPRVLGTIATFDTLGDWSGDLVDLVPKICGLILCDDPVTGGPAGGWCDICLGGGGRGIDLGLFNSIGNYPPGSGFVAPPAGVPVAPRCDEWEPIGPRNVSGRITSLAADPVDSSLIYTGSAGGGVFKSEDAGLTWRPLWEKELSLAIGGLAVAPSDPRTLYAATGEWAGPFAAPNNHFPGVGVYRSVDRGATWDLLAPIASRETSAVAVDPTDPARVYVAGNLGLHRTRDAGASWDVTPGHVAGVFDGLVTDVVVDPANALRVYIGVFNDGVYRSTDGGTSWTKLTSQANGIAEGVAASAPKIAIGRAGTHGTLFVAVLMDHKVYTSVDGGASFTRKADVAQPNASGSDPAWCACIAVDPTNEDVLIGGHVFLARTVNGGASWSVVGTAVDPNTGRSVVHADTQAAIFGVADHQRVLVASDGGVALSTDNGQTWASSSVGLSTSQCWWVAASHAPANVRVAITTQDNSSYESAPSGIFKILVGQEGGLAAYDKNDVLYVGTGFAPLQKTADDGVTWTVVQPPQLGLTSDLAIGPTDPQLLLSAFVDGGAISTGWLFRSTDGGATWTLVYGGASNTRPVLVAIAASDEQHVYVGDLDGGVLHSADRGVTIGTLQGAGLPSRPPSAIAVDPHDAKRVYVGLGGLGVHHLWRGDVGATSVSVTWTDISGRIAPWSLPDLPITAVAVHPNITDEIFVSNLLGVYRSIDGGDSWTPFDDGLPNVYVSHLHVRSGSAVDLYASTMGRGVYRRRV